MPRVNGYPTTQAEADAAAAMQAEYDRKMEAMVFKALNTVAQQYLAKFPDNK